MFNKNTIELIYSNLLEVQNQVASIGAEEKIHTIDIDLVLSKMRSTYELMLNLKNDLPSNHPEKLLDLQDTMPEAKPVPETKAPIFEVPEKPEESLPVEPPTVRINAPVIKNIVENVKQEFSSESREVLSSSRTSVGKTGSVLGEKLVGEKHSLNEELSKNAAPDALSLKLNTKPIASISSAIGLNEKFELIQNLFNGSSEKYNHTMHVLNMASNFNEAYNYLKESFNWDMDNPYVQRILELIRRKLIVNKNE